MLSEDKLKHFSYVKKYIYVLPIPEGSKQPLILNDLNSMTIAEEIKLIEGDNEKVIENLSDEEFKEALTVVKKIRYADANYKNLRWKIEDGCKKLVIIDTEDVAKEFTLSDNRLKFYCHNPFDVPWHNHTKSFAIAKQAGNLLTNHPETARQIIQLLIIYHKGIMPFKPSENELVKQQIFKEVTKEIEKELQALFKSANVDIIIDLIE